MARHKTAASRAPAPAPAKPKALTRGNMEISEHTSNPHTTSPPPPGPPPTAPTAVPDDESTSCVPAPQPPKKKPPATELKMADPFEVRMRFTGQLQHLNASVTSAQKAAHYALKYRDMDEDLHSCILEQLERNTLNNRANIAYFIPHLCDLSTREGHPEYTRFIQRDILKIIDLVAPDDGSGAANVKVVRKVLADLQVKGFLQRQTVVELEECIKDRDTLGGVAAVDEDGRGQDGGVGGFGRREGGTPRLNGSVRLDKRQIEQRIEEDRERHKRLRESIWAVGAADGEEFEKLMDETSELGDDDFMEVEEEVGERRQGARFQALL